MSEFYESLMAVCDLINVIELYKLFVSAPSPPPADARSGVALPPSHLVPLSSSVAVKKKKKRRDRAALLADRSSASSTPGYTSPVQPQVLSERSRSPSASRSRASSVPTKHSGVSDEPAHDSRHEVFDHPTRQSQLALYDNRSDYIPSSQLIWFVGYYIIQDELCSVQHSVCSILYHRSHNNFVQGQL